MTFPESQRTSPIKIQEGFGKKVCLTNASGSAVKTQNMASPALVVVVVGARRGVGLELVKHLSAQSASSIAEIRCCVRDAAPTDATASTSGSTSTGSALDDAAAADARVRVCRGADATDAASLAKYVGRSSRI